MHDPSRIQFLVVLLLATIPAQVGCVALNIPSERLHDAGDQGGLFGSWRSNHASAPHHHMVRDGDSGESWGLDGGPLEVDPFDPSCDGTGEPKPPEIPWPRFHPVPTRPVFGPS